jgi:hypothetical protein
MFYDAENLMPYPSKARLHASGKKNRKEKEFRLIIRERAEDYDIS